MAKAMTVYERSARTVALLRTQARAYVKHDPSKVEAWLELIRGIEALSTDTVPTLQPHTVEAEFEQYENITPCNLNGEPTNWDDPNIDPAYYQYRDAYRQYTAHTVPTQRASLPPPRPAPAPLPRG